MITPLERIADRPLPTEGELLFGLSTTFKTAWNLGLKSSDIMHWLSNFKGECLPLDYERRMALWLLHNFVLYTDSEVRALVRLLYRRFLRHALSSIGAKTENTIRAAIDDLSRRSRFCELGQPSESSGYLLYPFRQENNLPSSCFLDAADPVPLIVDTIIFIDDVCLTGTQASLYASRLPSEFITRRKILLTFFAAKEALEFLKKVNIELIPLQILDERSMAFSANADTFANFPEHREPGLRFAKHYGEIAFSKAPLGFGASAYCFGFHYNTPDNALPILWSQENGWIPILKRYPKVYSGKALHVPAGKFI